jgi:hypothetical protein
MNGTLARFLLPLVFATILASGAAADQARQVPDAPASFALSGDQRWIVVVERQDGEAAIGIAREQLYQDPKVQVARTRDGKYAVLIGPQAQMSAEQLKDKFGEEKIVRQSRGEEFVARAWQSVDARLAAAEMQEGRAASASLGALTLALRVLPLKKKKDEETYVVVAEGRENGKVAFTARSEVLFSPEPAAKASLVKLEGANPQAVFTYYSGGAHCCALTSIATRDAGKWQVLKPFRLDGDQGPLFEDLDGDGEQEMLSGDNRFLYEFAAYAYSAMPARIEKLIGGKIVDVTRRPEYRRYHQQYLAAMEDRASADRWKESGFLAGWVAQKILLGEGAAAFARLAKSFDPATGAPFEECMIDRPLEKCPENRKKQVSFADALRKFLDKNGYR